MRTYLGIYLKIQAGNHLIMLYLGRAKKSKEGDCCGWIFLEVRSYYTGKGNLHLKWNINSKLIIFKKVRGLRCKKKNMECWGKVAWETVEFKQKGSLDITIIIKNKLSRCKLIMILGRETTRCYWSRWWVRGSYRFLKKMIWRKNTC